MTYAPMYSGTFLGLYTCYINNLFLDSRNFKIFVKIIIHDFFNKIGS